MVIALQFHESGAILASGDEGGCLYVWERDTQKVHYASVFAKTSIGSLAWHGERLLVGTGRGHLHTYIFNQVSLAPLISTGHD